MGWVGLEFEKNILVKVVVFSVLVMGGKQSQRTLVGLELGWAGLGWSLKREKVIDYNSQYLTPEPIIGGRGLLIC